jgi:hypothetical protein
MGEGLADVEAGLAVGAGIDRIVAPEHDALGGNVAGEIADREIAHGQDAGVHPGVKALREARFAPIGGAERVAETGNPADMMPPGAGAEGDGLGAIFGADRQQAG